MKIEVVKVEGVKKEGRYGERRVFKEGEPCRQRKDRSVIHKLLVEESV